MGEIALFNDVEDKTRCALRSEWLESLDAGNLSLNRTAIARSARSLAHGQYTDAKYRRQRKLHRCRQIAVATNTGNFPNWVLLPIAMSQQREPRDSAASLPDPCHQKAMSRANKESTLCVLQFISCELQPLNLLRDCKQKL